MKADQQTDEGYIEQKMDEPSFLNSLTDDQKAELAFRLLRNIPLSKTRQVVDSLQLILNKDRISYLPKEIVLNVLYYLDIPSLHHMSQTSKFWFYTCQDQILWKYLFLEQQWTVNQAAIDRYLTYCRPRSHHGIIQKTLKVISNYAPETSTTSSSSSSSFIVNDAPLRSLNNFEQSQQQQQQQSQDKEVISRVIVERFSNTSLSNRRYPRIFSETAYFHYDESEDRRFINWMRLYHNRLKIAKRWKKVQCNMKMFPPLQSYMITAQPTTTTTTATTTISTEVGPAQNENIENEVSRPTNESTLEQQHQQQNQNSGIYCLQFNDQILMTGSRDRCIKVWSIRTGRLKHKLQGHLGSVLCLQFDNHYVISGSSDSRLMIWELHTGKHIKTLYGHSESVLNVKFKNNLVVSCSKDKTLRTWDWKKDDIKESDSRHNDKKRGGVTLMVFRGHRAAVNAVQFKDDRIVSASGDRTIKIWDMNTGQCLKTLDSHSRGIACVEYDGEYIVSGSSDQSIRVWNAHTGECIHILIGHTDLVRTLQMNRTFKTIVSGSYDGTVKIWNLEDGKLIKTLPQTAHGRILNLQFDFSKIVCCSNYGRIVIYDFASGIDTQFLQG
ncbi:WD40-repeat-containing domain protein [Mycotypha africana]|uniref:WD40-repeat-containing domain protein n=1 Tax=Mycotypha africana TaxID=64632 RepID=UPI002300A217|nr:WD40-repeat-containing domain protein [Mycotypha africana]KAI8971756.1 WD40-repeat-containing domain protein [Mycotypha africana]